MRIALDIDGVVCDFAGPCNSWLASALGRERIPITRWDWYRDYGEPLGRRAWRLFWGHAEDTEFFNHLPIIHGAKKGVDALFDQGHDVRFITARNPLQFGRQTREWLARHDLPVDVLYAEHKADHIDEFDVLVDDAPRHLADWRRAGGQPLVFNQPWNKECASWPGVSDWNALTIRMRHHAVQ